MRLDVEAQKKANAEAPPIPHLWHRVAQMFRPYRGRIVLTAILVVAGAILTVAPPAHF